MSEKFLKLDEEKKARIIRAALKEFAEKGYKQASTNQIVKQAGIGKGMLFYYFNSKEELFHFLLNYSFDILLNHYLSLIREDIDDLIERLADISRLKLQLITEFPEVNEFLSKFFLDNGLEIPEAARKKYEEVYTLSLAKVYGNRNINKSLFRDDVDPDKAYQLIEWSIQGYQNDLLARFNGKTVQDVDIDPLWDEFDDYLEILKTCFYK